MKSRIGNLVVIVLGATLFYGGTGCGAKPSTATPSTAASSDIPSEQKLLGKWLVVESANGGPPVGTTWEFLADGKINSVKTENNQQQNAAGTYTTDGSQRLTVVLGNSFGCYFSFPKDNELFLDENDGKGQAWIKFSRVNEPPATNPPK